MQRLLIANRSAIATRIIRTCKKLGIETVVPFTDADENWLPRFQADYAINIGEGLSTTSYLDENKLLSICFKHGIQGIHPGYGFLSENASFAKKVTDAGITFIGPSHSVISLMADKTQAKAFVESIGIPCIPGIALDDYSYEMVSARAESVGYPIMLKAACGGGGMGIRLINNATELKEGLQAVRQEAQSAFGDDSLLIEKFFPSIRHIEVQVIGDKYGNVVHAYDRECSIQRRRQKIIEEAPAPNLSYDIRQKMFDYAVKIAKASSYSGVGTIEFVVTAQPNQPAECYFLEMNTRIQVEHGVTEEITDIDLVESQIKIAMGEALPFTQEQIYAKGHAVQARLCAEDPLQRFMPSSGVVFSFISPRTPIRFETAICDSALVSGYYDSLLAKLIAKAESRRGAITDLQIALKETRILGVKTNGAFIDRILAHQMFQTSTATTRFVDDNLPTLINTLDVTNKANEVAIAATMFAIKESHISDGLRVQAFERLYTIENASNVDQVKISYDGKNTFVITFENDETVHVRKVLGYKNNIKMTIDGLEQNFHIHWQNERLHLGTNFANSSVFKVQLYKDSQLDTKDQYQNFGKIVSPLTGQVESVLVGVGDKVREGQTLVLLESMKMEHSLKAPFSGLISSISVDVGGAIKTEQEILQMTKSNHAGEKQ